FYFGGQNSDCRISFGSLTSQRDLSALVTSMAANTEKSSDSDVAMQSKKYSFDDKRKLKELIQKKKEQYDAAVEGAEKVYDRRRNKFVQKIPTEFQHGYISAAVREFSPDLANAKTTDKAFEQARSFANRCFHKNFNKEPTIINGDQMPLHRNESSGQKTLSMKDDTTYVKENYLLSRERVTVFTQVSTATSPNPEFLFKGKGSRIKVNPPENVHTQFALKGSYRLENMLTTIGGGITGDVQVNDTHYHHRLKKEYRERESKLVLEKLSDNPNRVPSPSRDEMMRMLVESWNSLEVDANQALKSLFVNNALDGSEDHLVSEKLFDLVGNTIVDFRDQLLREQPPKNVRDLMKTITPPKGVRRKAVAAGEQPADEGVELMDCEGDEIPEDELVHELVDDGEPEVDDLAAPPAISSPLQSSKPGPSPSSSSCDAGPSTSTSYTTARTSSNKLSGLSASDDIKKDAEFLDKMKDLLDTQPTSQSFIPFYLSFKVNYSKAKKNLQKRLQNETKVLEILQNKEPSESDKNTKLQMTENETMDVDDMASEEKMEMEKTTSATGNTSSECKVDKIRDLSVGQYCMVTNGQASMPACVTSCNPLAVRYFELGPQGLHCAVDYTQEILQEDVAKLLEEPETDFLKPGMFGAIVESTKQVAGYCENEYIFKTPSLASKLGHSLKTCAEMLEAEGIENKDEQLVEDVRGYLKLHQMRWNEEISAHASRSLTHLKKSQGIILFNRRRSGEASKLKLEDLNQQPTHDSDVLESLSDFEKKLCKRLSRIEIFGKRGRLVPILLAGKLKAALDLLVEKREAARISPLNKFVFACPYFQSEGHLRGSDVLRKFVGSAHLVEPQLITSTSLRKQVATQGQ
ncbi:hypothetical protein BaRGS_00036926, partial [Batillaria attramentaria]